MRVVLLLNLQHFKMILMALETALWAGAWTQLNAHGWNLSRPGKLLPAAAYNHQKDTMYSHRMGSLSNCPTACICHVCMVFHFWQKDVFLESLVGTNSLYRCGRDRPFVRTVSMAKLQWLSSEFPYH